MFQRLIIQFSLCYLWNGRWKEVKNKGEPAGRLTFDTFEDPLSHTHERRRAKRSGGKESGEDTPRKFFVSWLRRSILRSQLRRARLYSRVRPLSG